MGPVIDLDTIREARDCINQIYTDDKIKEYIVAIVFATREAQSVSSDLADYIRYGASPRTTIALALAAKAWAFLQGRGYVIPQDVKSIRHGCTPAPHHPHVRSRS